MTWSSENQREYMRRYYAQNHDQLNAARRAVRRTPDGDVIRAKARAKYAKNKLRIREQQRVARLRNPDLARRKQNAARYGLTLAAYDYFLAQPCAVCESRERLHIDHCHKTGLVRGTLCAKCNTAIGLLQENRTFLQKAIAYLALAQGA